MEFCPDNNCGDMSKVFICCPYSKQAGSACPIADSCVGQDVVLFLLLVPASDSVAFTEML